MTSYARRQRERDRRIGALPNPNEVVVEFQRLPYLFALAVGLLFAGGGAWLISDLGTNAWKAAACAIVPGVFLVAVTLRQVLSSAPLLRADVDGVAFRHGPKMPWSEVRSLRPFHFGRREAIDLRVDPRRTRRYLPLAVYVRARLTRGSVLVDVPPGKERAHLLVQRMDAMRVGVHDGEAIRGAGEALPEARVVLR